MSALEACVLVARLHCHWCVAGLVGRVVLCWSGLLCHARNFSAVYRHYPGDWLHAKHAGNGQVASTAACVFRILARNCSVASDCFRGAGGSLHPTQGVSPDMCRLCVFLACGLVVHGSTFLVFVRHLLDCSARAVCLVDSQHLHRLSVHSKRLALWRSHSLLRGE